MHRMAKGLCSPVNYAALADDLGISQPTARRRIDELREAFVLWPCHREDGLRPKLNAQAKTYFTDPVYARLVPAPTIARSAFHVAKENRTMRDKMKDLLARTFIVLFGIAVYFITTGFQ